MDFNTFYFCKSEIYHLLLWRWAEEKRVIFYFTGLPHRAVSLKPAYKQAYHFCLVAGERQHEKDPQYLRVKELREQKLGC